MFIIMSSRLTESRFDYRQYSVKYLPTGNILKIFPWWGWITVWRALIYNIETVVIRFLWRKRINKRYI